MTLIELKIKKGCVKIGAALPYTGLCGCSMKQPYRANTLIVKSVGMLPGASAEYTSLSMNVQHIKKIRAASIFDTAHCFVISALVISYKK